MSKYDGWHFRVEDYVIPSAVLNVKFIIWYIWDKRKGYSRSVPVLLPVWLEMNSKDSEGLALQCRSKEIEYGTVNNWFLNIFIVN